MFNRHESFADSFNLAGSHLAIVFELDAIIDQHIFGINNKSHFFSFLRVSNGYTQLYYSYRQSQPQTFNFSRIRRKSLPHKGLRQTPPAAEALNPYGIRIYVKKARSAGVEPAIRSNK